MSKNSRGTQPQKPKVGNPFKNGNGNGKPSKRQGVVLGINSKVVTKANFDKLSPKDQKKVIMLAQTIEGFTTRKDLSQEKYKAKQHRKEVQAKSAALTGVSITGSNAAQKVSESKVDEQIAYYNALVNAGSNENLKDDEQFIDTPTEGDKL